jgi:beta-galactosidase
VITRRAFLHRGFRAGMAAALTPVLSRHLAKGQQAHSNGPATHLLALDGEWRFGGKFDPSATVPDFRDKSFAHVTIPHCVTRLSWQDWDPSSWENIWIYRRPFSLPREVEGLRVFLQFDGVMVNTTPALNGHDLPTHSGGYLPFEYEVTQLLNNGENLLAVAVDARWSDVPPEGSPQGPSRIDYLEPGGIYRPVRLKAVPGIFIRDVFAKPVQVLDPTRHIDVICTLDAAVLPGRNVEVLAELQSEGNLLARTRESVELQHTGGTEVRFTLKCPGNILLWDVDAPRLCDLITTLLVNGRPVHDHHIRIGFRDARFELNGFFLNGRRLQLFGLNRHQLYPFAGAAMPARVQRRDAAILRHELNCNIVRCSHYPQSEDFLNACDEVGMMVWEEVPGWGYLGDAAWKDLLVRDVGDMIRRDRNHASIVIWGVRANESSNDVELYRRTTALAHALDDSRPASGSMTPTSRRSWMESWHEDVFAYDDYHSNPDGSVGIEEPVGGVPYMLSEAVGQFNYPARKGFDNYYRRAGDAAVQMQQAIWHAQAHSRAAANPGNCGVIAWCAFEYASLINAIGAVKYPGVCDTFRIPKLGASFYRAQVDPHRRPVIEPNFYWDFGVQAPHGPGRNAAIFSNCDRLELFVDKQHHATLHPDSHNYAHLRHAPFFADLEFDAPAPPELLRIDGYLDGNLVLSRSFSSNPRHDRFVCEADDRELAGDGVDATRLVGRVVDCYGAPRAFAGGAVSFEITGPGVLVGDTPLDLAATGGAAAVWIRTRATAPGTIHVTARHSTLGAVMTEIAVRPAEDP